MPNHNLTENQLYVHKIENNRQMITIVIKIEHIFVIRTE